MQTASHKRILFLTQFSILLAIEAIFCFTPLGSIPFTPAIVATLAMVPVIITGILLGTGAGTAMGFIAGLFSFIVWTFIPPNPATAFVFTPFYSIGEIHGNLWSLVICFVPRILTGTVAGLTFKGMRKIFPKGKDFLVYGLSSCLGSLTNTLPVLFGIYFFFGKPYAEVLGIGYQLLLGLVGTSILTNGVPEAIISVLAGYFICKPIHMYMNKR